MKKTLKLLFLLSTLTSNLMALPLKSDETVCFIPSLAYVSGGQVFIEVNAWVYENADKVGFDTVLAKYSGIQRASLNNAEREYFSSQTALFKVDSERGKTLTIKFANGTTRTLVTTDRAGRSVNTLSFDITELAALMDAESRITFTLAEDETIQGYATFHQDKGHLVISDIDDTIKDSHVLDRKALLKNTFVHPPKIVTGMPARFKTIANNAHTTFVYVSSSPIQLYPTLSKFIDEYYPQGVLRLRQSTAWNEVIASKATSIDHKKSTIIQLLEAYPNKSVTLIGDSGEHDPEIYQEIFTLYPERIQAMIIRNVSNESIEHMRYQSFPKAILMLLAP